VPSLKSFFSKKKAQNVELHTKKDNVMIELETRMQQRKYELDDAAH
jgi:hypothetical protein